MKVRACVYYFYIVIPRPKHCLCRYQSNMLRMQERGGGGSGGSRGESSGGLELYLLSSENFAKKDKNIQFNLMIYQAR